MTDWNEHEDAICDAISDSIDMDWTSRIGAKAVVAWLNENVPAAPQAAGVGDPQVHRLLQLADATLSKVAAYEADFRSLLGHEGYSQADNVRSEIRQFLLALATREEAPAEAGEDADRLMREFYLSRDYDPKAARPADTVKAAIAFALRAQPQAREDAQPFISAGRVLADALRQYGFPVSGGAKAALSDHGSAEAIALNEACVAFLATLQAEQKGGA